MARIPETEIARIKAETDLIALIQARGTVLKKQGTNWIGLCPFHDDQKTPNLIVTPGKGLFRCMAGGCGKTGNAIQFVQWFDGLSFRHAFELLADGGKAAFESANASGQPKQASRNPKLPCPLDGTGAALLGQVADYYADRLARSPAALDYLKIRGLDDEKLVRKFKIGFSDRTLGLRIPQKTRADGAALRGELQTLGVYRKNGREHLNGCLTIPIFDLQNEARQIYGRRIDRATPKENRHLYLARPKAGIFNPDALKNREVILCESILDALTFYHHGMEAVTCIFGTESFPDELLQALLAAKVESVKFAYDNDEAGERAFLRDAETLLAHGIQTHRIKFRWEMDANQFALEEGGEALRQAVRNSIWYGEPGPNGDEPGPNGDEPGPNGVQASRLNKTEAVAEAEAEALSLDAEGSPLKGVWASGPNEQNPSPESKPETPQKSQKAASQKSATAQKTEAPAVVKATPAPASSLVAKAAKEPEAPLLAAKAAPEEAAKKESSSEPEIALTRTGDHHAVTFGQRLYRIGGLEKNNSLEVLRITLRVTHDGLLHVDSLDLYRDGERRKFIERAAEETLLERDLLKRDLGKLLLLLEQTQEKRLSTGAEPTDTHELSADETTEARTFLQSPNLLQNIAKSYDQAGIAGEANNLLAAYLACASRKLAKPLAVIIQSTSAAGKSTLMEAVLSFFPNEDQVKYSAMTGQSLYYLGETNLKHKILAIVEEEGAEKASYALKLLQSEGELTIASTGKDPKSGRMETQEYHVEGPVAIILTTTSIDIDEELMNRCLVLTVDESPEQTERIHALQREARTIEGILKSEQRKDITRVMQNAQRLILPMKIANPFARHLTFTSGRTRTRRDHEKYLTLIDTIALLHQHQREPITHQINGREIQMLPVTLADIEAANAIAPEVLGRSLDELPPQTRRLLESIKALIRARMKTDSTEQRTTLFSRRELREFTGWSYMQVKRHLDRLLELEHISTRGGRNGMQMKYEFLSDLEEGGETFHIGLIDVQKLREKGIYDDNLNGENGDLTKP